jgi:acyl-CoA thioesterase-1
MSLDRIARWFVLLILSGFPHLLQAGTIVVLGDSASAGYGIAQGAGWVSLLGQRVAKFAPDHRVVNASISGETAAGGKRRIDTVLDQHKPAMVVIALGGNDGLRGTKPETIEADLEMVIKAGIARKVRVVLVGMRMPPNYGATYARQFHDVYTRLASKHPVSLVPFLFEGFGERHDMFQADGIHPTREAQALMLENVWKVVGPLLTRPSPGVPRR